MILPDAANTLFRYNLIQVARKFGLVEDDGSRLQIGIATEALNLSEEYSFSYTNEDRLLSLLLCAMTWENREDDWHGIKPFIARILIRLGLATSAKMINWNADNQLFSSLGSLIEELTSTTKLISYEVTINGKVLILSDFQKRMWDAIDDNSRIGISAPTSAGKSFILVHKILDILSQEEGKVFFIVPTISLVNQVCNDLRKQIKHFKLYDIYLYQTVNDISLFRSDKSIYVLTQERAASALNHPNADFTNIKLLIVDEIQNIEKVTNEGDQRAQILLDVIQTFKNDLEPEKIILSGPRLENIQELVKKWFGDIGRSVSESLPAVINATYSFVPKRGKLLFEQYLVEGISHSIEIEDKFNLKKDIISKVRYSEKANDFIAYIIDRNKKDGNIIFSDTTKNANEIALQVAKRLGTDGVTDKIASIKDFIESTVHPKYSLVESVAKGVAYHHGKMPPHIRILVEKLFANKDLNTVVSTTTLMQGVNLPAKNIIIRNPKVGDELLTGYEFSNLKGRAGRLMKDFVGRALIIDQKKCNDANIDLQITAQKSLNMGYGERYQNERAEIDSVLKLNAESESKSNDLITYIRSTCLKYGITALFRLREVGITIDTELLNESFANLNALEVPSSICIVNFYWDPLVLNRLFLSFKDTVWPEVPSDVTGSALKLKDLIIRMSIEAPFYYQRYMGDIDPETEHGERKIWSLCIYAEQYGRGRMLKDVINPFNFPIETSEDIDDRIEDIHRKIVFDIPKLLKPIFNINDLINEAKTSQILSFIEVGAVDTKLRTLIELGIPRETAIAMLQRDNSVNFLNSENKVIEELIGRFIHQAKNDPNFSVWHKLLIEDL